MSVLEYKGYISNVEYSSEDKCLYGKLEMINDLVTFEALNVEELESNFKQVVDDYILTCKELNRETQKVFKGVFNVRIKPELHKKLHMRAIKKGVSLNTLVEHSLTKAL